MSKRMEKPINFSGTCSRQGKTPMDNVKLRKEWINSAINRLDPALFATHLPAWLELVSHLQSRPVGTRGAAAQQPIPRLSTAQLRDPRISSVADDTVFAFCIAAILHNNSEVVGKLETELMNHYGLDFPGSRALALCRHGRETENALDDAAGRIVQARLDGQAFDPKDVWNAGLRLLEKVRKSNFVQELSVMLAKWLREQWQQILKEQRFNLSYPRVSVPPIEAALEVNLNDQAFAASLLLAATAAVDIELDPAYQEHLEAIASRS
ncbi:hypothetical protein [Methylovirgula sp. HY1]|uniref:hypothetical protein n=1 Tax=Methylovirgula sp. HY1 TaxID=2822761 RepID=UPI001C5AEAF4|nr:hypothetical protein [Methylovirgula sp. HY1]QXX75399.1 hypothetical protein MHY1_02218 [Methylovirgula sp. HY1]